jgi:hypothetical protein
VERERLTDSQLKLESVTASLKQVNPKKIPGFSEIEECLQDADETLKEALRESHSRPHRGD